jgi:hypothetical protein
MMKALMGALTGFCLGAVLGYFSYSVAYDEKVPGGWTVYAPGRGTLPGGKQWVSPVGLVGMVHGGGLAAIVGAVIGAAGAIVEAVRESRRFGPPPPQA